MPLLIIAFIGTFGLICSAGLLIFHRDAVRDRLAEFVEQRVGPAGRFTRLTGPRQSAIERAVRPFQDLLPRNSRELSLVQKRLVRAGFRQPSALNIYYGGKVLLPLSLVILTVISGVYRLGSAFSLLAAAGLGFMAPDLWLSNRIASRKQALSNGLPEALDLMVVCAEAGLSIDQTLQRVSRELRVSQPEIAEELGLAMLEQKAGKPRDEALNALADRANVPSMKAFVNTLVQSDAFGTSISKSLRIYSDTLRTQRRQKAEEEAAKTTVKLIFPLVVFIFPSLFVVVLGPSLISLSETMTRFISTVGK